MKFKFAYEKYMNIIGPIGNLMFYLQAFKLFSSKSAEDISLFGFWFSFIGLSCWLLYGFLIKNTPLILANLVGVIGASLVLILTIIYN